MKHVFNLTKEEKALTHAAKEEGAVMSPVFKDSKEAIAWLDS